MIARQSLRPLRVLNPSYLIRHPQSTFRNFQTSARLMETPTTALPVRKPIGAFRGGMFGFLLGSTLTGAGVYYYILEEYKVSNEMLTEDIYALQSAVQRIHGHVQNLEEKLQASERTTRR